MEIGGIKESFFKILHCLCASAILLEKSQSEEFNNGLLEKRGAEATLTRFIPTKDLIE